jgi:flagellar hook assembly protein FlgD
VLEKNFPNPANPSTNIGYSLASDGPVELRVYNMMGQVIRTLVDGYQVAGHYAVQWDGKDDSGLSVASGVDLSRLQAGNRVEARQLLLLR